MRTVPQSWTPERCFYNYHVLQLMDFVNPDARIRYKIFSIKLEWTVRGQTSAILNCFMQSTQCTTINILFLYVLSFPCL